MRFYSAISAVVVVCLSLGTEAHAATHYRSIGTALDYSVGTVSVMNGETHVIGTLDVKWRTENRGRGDRITIGGVDYTIFSVDAENELTLTAPYAGLTSSGVTYTIARKFSKLKDWADCIQNIAPCPDVVSPSLVSDERVEIGVVYKDSVFFMNTGGEVLRFETATITDATYSITLTTNPPNRHHGVAGTGVILDNGTSVNPMIEILTDFVTIEWIELRLGGANCAQISVSSQNISNQIVLRNLLSHDDDGASIDGVYTNSNNLHLLAYNNVFYRLTNGVSINGLSVASTASLELYHNTFYNSEVGLVSSTSSGAHNDVIFIRSNVAFGNSFQDFWVPNPNPASSHNYASDDSGTPISSSGGRDFVTVGEIQFVSTALDAEDLHIKRGSVAEDKGPPIAQVTDDVDGRLRGSPDIGADEADSSSANPVKVLTARSSDLSALLEWQTPDFGPMDFVEIRRDPTVAPATPAAGSLACTVAAPVPGSHASCSDALSLTNGVPHYYSAFVYDFGGNWSQETSVEALPFDATVEPPEWTYKTNATTLAEAGVRSTSTYVVSQDDRLHGMLGDVAGGQWLSGGWAPYKLPFPAQHRPVIVNVGGNLTALLGAQDARVYAIDILTGLLRWKSPVLGTLINAPPVALVRPAALGAPADHVFVGTADPGTNAMYILDLFTGALVGLVRRRRETRTISGRSPASR